MVAVLDTGIDLDHPDLQANIWTNPDPGQDGYTDDVHGWNFVANDNDPNDDYGHGTHVAGISARSATTASACRVSTGR